MLTGGPIDLEEYRAEMQQTPAYMQRLARRSLQRATCSAACRGSWRWARP